MASVVKGRKNVITGAYMSDGGLQGEKREWDEKMASDGW